MTKLRILFMCTANSARSQMAEALLRHHAGGKFDVYSAGLEPGAVHPLAVKVLEEAGVSTEGLYSKGWRAMLDKGWFRLVVFVCDKAESKCPTAFLSAKERWSWPFTDPSGTKGTDDEQLAAFRRVRDEIAARVSTLPALLTHEGAKV